MFGILIDIATFASLVIAILTLNTVQNLLKPKYKIISYEQIIKNRKLSFIYIKEQLKALVEDYRNIFYTKQEGLEAVIDKLKEMPESWRIVIHKNKAIGIWVLYNLDEEMYNKIHNMPFSLIADELLQTKVRSKNCTHGYLWMIAIDTEHMTYYGTKAICKGFLNYLYELACNDVYYEELFANPESSIGISLVEAIGFKRIKEDNVNGLLHYIPKVADTDTNSESEIRFENYFWYHIKKYKIMKRYKKHFEKLEI